MSLWRHPDFRKLWAGQTVSEIGSRITRDGIPITAVMLLHATPWQMGILASLTGIAALSAGTIAGAAADRLPRRGILIVSDLGRAFVLAMVPLAAMAGLLSLGQLYAVIFAAGILTIFFDVAYQSYLPSLVAPSELLEGNGKLALSTATAEVLGPGITGILVQTLTAPRAILLDSLSFLVSAASILLIRVREPHPAAPVRASGPHPAAGFRYLAGNPILRALFLRSATFALFIGFLSTLYVFYAIDELRLSPWLYGIVVALGGVGNFVGASLSDRMVRRVPLGRLLVGCTLWNGVINFLIPLAHGSPVLAAVFLGAAQLLGDAAYPIYSVHELTLRQQMVPPEILGRVNAAMQLAFKGLWPVGALVGGALGSTLGTRPTMFLCAGGVLLSAVWLIASPVAGLREYPEDALSRARSA